MPGSLRRLLLLALFAVSTGCACAADLTVSAAASLTNAFKELAPLFEAQNPGTRVLLNFGASGALLAQIAKGAPVDVLASADPETMDQAQKQSLVRASERRDIASNKLVLIVPAKARADPVSLADLSKAEYARIAMGVPASVPVGRYAKAALEKAGLWSALQTKIIGAQNARQALDYVARGEVDAGFVFATDAALMPGKVRVVIDVPTGTPIRYPAAPVSFSTKAAMACRFVSFLLSDEAQRVLLRHGFGHP